MYNKGFIFFFFFVFLGSKILPFLNMSNSQQITNTTQNNWPSSYNTQLQQQQHKSKYSIIFIMF